MKRMDLIRGLLWSVVLALSLNGCQAVYQDCENPPAVKHSSVDIEDGEEFIRASYSCRNGYELQGPKELLCDLSNEQWNTDPPTCVKVEDAAGAGSQNKRKKVLDIIEDSSITEEIANRLDMTCVQAKVKAPEIKNGYVLQYDRRRRGEHVFLVAFYACDEKYELEDSEVNSLFCSQEYWIGDLPTCILLGEYDDDNAGGEQDDYDDAETLEDNEADEKNAEMGSNGLEDAINQALPPPAVISNMSSEDSSFNELIPEANENEAKEADSASQGSSDASTDDAESAESPVSDPYEPQILDSDCGEDNGGCEHGCQRLLFPGENEARNKCYCEKGYALDLYDYSSCHDIDECQIQNGGCEQICNNLPGSFQCSCEQGLQIDTNTGNTCIDIDECQQPDVAAACTNGCENSYGTYRCLSPSNEDQVEPSKENIVEEDYKNESAETGKSSNVSPTNQITSGSVDVFDCPEAEYDCKKCKKTGESIQCVCPSGFYPSEEGRSCLDINECEIVAGDEAGDGYRRPCMRQCINTPGSFFCACNDNEHLAEDQRNCLADSCLDLKNSQLNKTRCAYQCIDLPSGVYECICPDGYKLNDDLHNCDVIVDGCAKENGYKSCAPGSCLTNEDNTSFSCVCPAGYTNDIFSCKDKDECASGEHKCSHDCVNTEGSYYCSCPPGYRFIEGDEHECEDINECQMKKDLCGSLQCSNFPGGFKCLCSDGTEPNSETGLCDVADACANRNCSHACIAEDSSFKCICPDGMTLHEDGLTCVFTDLCALNNNGCDQICLSERSGACACEDGYVLADDAKKCVDIDECLQNNGHCEQFCSNFPGAYACECREGFKLAEDRHACLDINECESNQHDCSNDCININGGYECVCPSGYILNSDKKTCLDIDECERNEHSCSHGCVNKNGSYVCTCPTADYRLDNDKKTCIKISPDYVQECPSGSILDTLSGECVVFDNCLNDNGGCSHICTADQGCSCPSGLTLQADSKTCVDIDECQSNNGNCLHLCKNTGGSFECLCPDGTLDLPGGSCDKKCSPGFMQNPANSSECIDIDECATPNTCQYKCTNTEGSFECSCPRGYRLKNGRDCVDINECLENKDVCIGGECINHNAGYECRCPAGSSLASDRRTCVKKSVLGDLCPRLTPPINGDIFCTKYRHKEKLFYTTRCNVWCKPGYELRGSQVRTCDSTGQWDDLQSECLPVACQPLLPPQNGKFLPDVCTSGNALSVGQRCHLKCNPGFTPIGNNETVCTAHKNWSLTSNLMNCVRLSHSLMGSRLPKIHNRLSNGVQHQMSFSQFPQLSHVPQAPFIKCPRNLTVYLNDGERTAQIALQSPITNLDARSIEISHPWTKRLQSQLAPGVHVVKFRVKNPFTGKFLGCQTFITILQGERPKVVYCTPSFEVSLAVNQAYSSVSWKEPIFESPNSRLKRVYKSRFPGELFGVGLHTVYYEAINDAGRTARCEFKINVKAAPVVSSQPAPHLQLIRPVSSPTNQAQKLLLPEHESYVICPGRSPVYVTSSQSVNLPVGCILKNIRRNRRRNHVTRSLLTTRFSPFSNL